MEKIQGLIVAPFTPFDKAGEVNYDIIPQYAEMLRKNGLKGVFINGSSGEGYMLTTEERIQLAEKWKASVPADFKIIVHVGSTCVKDSKKMAEHAQALGVFGIGSMAPPFPKIGRVEELITYCQKITEGAPELPFYYYHIPVFNGAYLSMVEFLEKADQKLPSLAGIKYTYENMYEFNQCKFVKNGKYDMLHGQDETLLASLAMSKTQGGISGTANYVGNVLVGVMEAWQKGNLEKARILQNYNQEVINVIVKYRGNIVGGKRIMKLMGLDLGENRVPFRNITAEEEAALLKDLEAIDFFNKCNEL
ncbi:N-acetylneuraminate lyase [Ornithobacterium rhinotracheale]|uniref:dihydrodipicolinate synthase family protein n=1 Tax=Ornithobacterium rhinotracheale TaxID=28251 RepID=UPI00129C4641|nr:dihydrodipicolinate synthase family protein [Ornithobacterium rhinotracheale]MRJ09263.1 N-acetylneuraminate lyase [Ornithobacterium rhinotracheale]UOH77203.1 dihydrodipicolinate synthase family protein [Ornithobacterium rhinotracheale]